MEVKIYGLYDPTDTTESIRYVGKTIQNLKIPWKLPKRILH